MLEEIVKKAKKENKKVYVYAHKFPDGDAIGSSCALVEYLKEQGIDARYVVTRENRAYSQVVGTISPITTIRNKQISVILDTSTVSYAENKLFRSSAKEDIYIIDHHETSEESTCIEDELGVPSQNVIRNAKASSTCEIITSELEKGNMTPKIANMLTLGLITDTAKLKFLKEDTLQNLSKLLEAGADYSYVSYVCNRKSRLADEVGLAKLFLEAEKFQIGDTFGMIMPVDKKKVKELTIRYGLRNIQKKIFKMADIENCSFNCMIAENEEGKYDLEFRSSTIYGNFDVFQLAITYGGGGHYHASGCAIEKEEKTDLETVSTTIKEQVIDHYSKQVENVLPIQETKQDEELSKILEKTKQLQKGITPQVLQQVNDLIRQGANYEYTYKTIKTLERFMLENEILSKVPEEKIFDRNPTVEIKLTQKDVALLKQNYKIEESDILSAITIFSNINVNTASITLPNGKKAQIDRNGCVKFEESRKKMDRENR